MKDKIILTARNLENPLYMKV